MEIINNIITAFTTENPTWIKIQSIPLSFIELYVYMLLFTTVLNIKTTRKQRIIYVLITAIVAIICTFFIPKPFDNIITFVVGPVAVITIFKTGLLKGIFANLIPIFVVVIIEMVLIRVFYIIFKIEYTVGLNIPLYRLIANFTVYALLVLLSLLFKKIK